MAARDTGAEQLIIDTARRLFFTEGRFTATTQDIADAAGVTRTLVNYYFRSKDVLFEKVFKEGMQEMGQKIDEVLIADLPFKKKTEQFIDVFSAEIMQFPYREVFMISELNHSGLVLPNKQPSAVLKGFLKEIQQAMDDGLVRKMKPINFMLNLFSLMSYPVIVRPLFKRLLDINEIQFEKVLHDRKKMIIDLLFI